MAESYGWAGQVLRVNLSTGAITKESIEKYKPYIGGTGLGWKVMWDEVPPGTRPFDLGNKVIFAVGPATGSGAPSSGRTSLITMWPVDPEELPSKGAFGGHWGPELKYAGYDAVIVEGESAKPVWLRIEDDKVTLEDASAIWGQGIYRSTNWICNLMGAEAHVVCIGQAGENLARLGAVFCDRSHRGGGAGGILGKKKLKAIGVRGTGAVRIAADKKAWRNLNNYYMSLIGANNQCVVARALAPWSEHSPGNTRWSGAPGIKWGSALPPVDMGNCPDAEHPMVDAPFPLNKVGFRTQKGYNDFGEEGLKRTVRMDGCHSCPIRCHIAADHPELENYGVSRYNMNTCMGNGGLRSTVVNTGGSNPQQNVMLCTYMSNHLEGDYGIWNDYGGWTYIWDYMYSEKITATDDIIPATVADTRPGAEPGATIPNPLIGQPLFAKYLSSAEWTRIRTTALWSSGKSPLALNEAGDPRWVQFLGADMAANKPGTLGWFMDRGPGWTAKEGAGLRTNGRSWADAMTYTPTGGTAVVIRPELPADYGCPELEHHMHEDYHLHMWKMSHTLHHSIENAGQVGGLVNAMQINRDMNNHTPQNFWGCGLPNSAALPVKRALAQEIACSKRTFFQVPDESTEDKWAYPLQTEWSPMNMARAGLIAQMIISYDLENSLTCCNYTLPVWMSPLKSRDNAYVDANGQPYPGEPHHLEINGVAVRGYRGDPELDVKVYNAVTGSNLTLAEWEKTGLRLWTLYRVYTSRVMNARRAGWGANMRESFDTAPAWAFKTVTGETSSVTFALRPRVDAAGLPIPGDPDDWNTGKTMMYQVFGFDTTTGQPTEARLNEIGLGDTIATLKADGVIP